LNQYQKIAKHIEAKLMKNLTKIAILVFLCFYVVSCFSLKYNLSSKKEPKGFRDIVWGADINSIPDMVLGREPYEGGIIYYTKKDEKLNIGVVDVKKIQYGFYKDKFCIVRIYFNSYFTPYMHSILKTAYGEPIRGDWVGQREDSLGKGKKLIGPPFDYFWENKRICIRHTIFQKAESDDMVIYTFKPIFEEQMRQDEKIIWEKGTKDL